MKLNELIERLTDIQSRWGGDIEVFNVTYSEHGHDEFAYEPDVRLVKLDDHMATRPTPYGTSTFYVEGSTRNDNILLIHTKV